MAYINNDPKSHPIIKGLTCAGAGAVSGMLIGEGIGVISAPKDIEKATNIVKKNKEWSENLKDVFESGTKLTERQEKTIKGIACNLRVNKLGVTGFITGSLIATLIADFMITKHTNKD